MKIPQPPLQRGIIDKQPKNSTPEAMEEFFNQEYDPWHYKGNPEDIKRANIIKKELLRYPITRLLDIGCCEGYLTHFLAPCAQYTLGIDVSPTAISRAINSYNSFCDFKTGNILYFRSDFQYDAVTITGVLYYVNNKWDKVFATLDNVLIKGGVLLTSHITESSKGDGYLSHFLKGEYNHERSIKFPYKRFTQSLNVFTKH
jgi:2-polyprenyl-3-methyl-5-hydroxy-6-metoxy-1,4-benzoquinol methylase